MNKHSESLLKQIKNASMHGEQFHFCEAYYSAHDPLICSIAHNGDNRSKNVHNHWGFPYDHNRIQTIPDYINASPMEFNKRKYIAAQGPRNNTFAAFWQMTLEEKAPLIVSVTNETEKKKEGMEEFKFHRFWPDSGTLTYGDVTVKLNTEQLVKEWVDGRNEKIRKRTFLITKGLEEHSVTHLHMENWPDGDVVHPESLIYLSKMADEVDSKGPIIVHCAAGVGRTGTFIAFHSLYHDFMEQVKQNIEEPILDIPERIREMRTLRWGAMVAETRQYELLLEALKIALSSKESSL